MAFYCSINFYIHILYSYILYSFNILLNGGLMRRVSSSIVFPVVYSVPTSTYKQATELNKYNHRRKKFVYSLMDIKLPISTIRLLIV